MDAKQLQAQLTEETYVADILYISSEEALKEQSLAKDSLDEAMAIRQQAIEAAAREAAAQAAAESEAQSGEQAGGESSGASSGSGAPAVDPVNSGNTDRDTFIAEWAPRIDAYMAGYPLAGYGSVFAAAAWDYGVDPRFSPAISWVESSRMS